MASGLSRGDVYDAETPGGRRPVVILTRDDALPVLTSVVVAAVTRTLHRHVAEVEIGAAEGVREHSAINCDTIHRIPTASLARRRGAVSGAKLIELDRALSIALGLV